MTLALHDVSVHFAGLRAVSDVSFEVATGKITALIGPNGAGKTTTFNVITGLQRPTEGRVFLDGKDLSRQGPAQRNRAGIGRTFQVVKPFGALTVRDNVVVGALTQGRSVREAKKVADGVLERLGMARFALAGARSLPIALRKRLELARALATDCRILLLDEIMGGLNATEVNETLDLIRQLNADGMTVLLTEHNMRAIMQISDHVVVLDHGALLAEGEPAEISRHPDVIAAYLGEPE